MGWLIGLALDAGTGQTVQSMPACLLWIGDDGRMSDDPEELTALLQSAAWRPWRAPSTEERQRALTVLAPVVRARLQETTGKSWPDSRREPEQGALERRLRALATRGARERNRALLQLLDAALAWLGGGLSAGEVALVRRASQLETSALVPALRRLLAVPRRYRAPVPRLTGVVRVGSLSACPSSAPSSLISTAR